MENVKMGKCENGEMWKCGNVKMGKSDYAGTGRSQSDANLFRIYSPVCRRKRSSRSSETTLIKLSSSPIRFNWLSSFLLVSETT